jgi:hypothetical protein
VLLLCLIAVAAGGEAHQHQLVQQRVLKVTNAVHSSIPGFLEVSLRRKYKNK